MSAQAQRHSHVLTYVDYGGIDVDRNRSLLSMYPCVRFVDYTDRTIAVATIAALLITPATVSASTVQPRKRCLPWS